jgi:hypothetical protein
MFDAKSKILPYPFSKGGIASCIGGPMAREGSDVVTPPVVNAEAFGSEPSARSMFHVEQSLVVLMSRWVTAAIMMKSPL